MADLAPPFIPPLARAPLVPEPLLHQHNCFIPSDTRFRAAARLRQSLWRQEQGLPAGLHRPGGKRELPRVTLGSTLQPADAAKGLNFFNPEVHAFVRYSLIVREEGAHVSYERLHRNLLSSEPLTYNLLVPLALNLDLATAVFRQLLPTFVDRVEAIRFETSPGRHHCRYLNDGTAFDAALSVITLDGEPATAFIEVKYSEACSGPAATHRPRYDEASREAALHHDPDAPALRSVTLEQFKRLHLLSQLAVRHGTTPRAHFIVLYPQLNRRVRVATHLYAAELIDPAGSSPASVGFTPLTLETFVSALAQAGGGAEASYLAHRYLDLTPVLNLVLAEANCGSDDEPPPSSPLPMLPPSSLTTGESPTCSKPDAKHDEVRPAAPTRRRTRRRLPSNPPESPAEAKADLSGKLKRAGSIKRTLQASSVTRVVAKEDRR